MAGHQIYKWVVTINDPSLELGSSTFQEDFSPENVIEMLTHLKCSNWCFQLERGKKTGRLHYQMSMNLVHKMVKSKLLLAFKRLAPSDEVYKNITIAPMQSETDSFNYSEKIDTRVLGPWSMKNSEYAGEDLPPFEEFFPYQKTIMYDFLIFIKNKIHRFGSSENRHINWLFDEKGSNGKSTLVKYLLWKYKKECSFVPFGTVTQMKACLIKRGPKRMYILDIPRTVGKTDSMDDVYALLEAVKNGVVQSSMYGEGDSTLLMNPPIVWVFSNQMPELSKLTADRWNIHHIDHNKCFKH